MTAPGFLTLDSDTKVMSLYTTDFDDVDVHTVTLTVMMKDYPAVTKYELTFKLLINRCLVTAFTSVQR